MPFKQGDSVRLKGQKLKMTVRGIIGDGTIPNMFEEPFKLAGASNGDVFCQWHEGSKDRAQVYPPGMLELANNVVVGVKLSRR